MVGCARDLLLVEARTEGIKDGGLLCLWEAAERVCVTYTALRDALGVLKEKGGLGPTLVDVEPVKTNGAPTLCAEAR